MNDVLERSDELDNYGPLTEPMPHDAPRYNFKGISEYCNRNNKRLEDLTENEIEKFRSTL